MPMASSRIIRPMVDQCPKMIGLPALTRCGCANHGT
jgi:hypothetical protein